MSVKEKMTAIADNIRDKTGGAEALTLDQMASGVNEVYGAGKKAEYNEFWNNFNYGQYAFAGQGWNKDTFKPNKDFTVNSYCFFYHNWLHEAYDLAEHIEKLGINLKFGSNSDTQTFRMAWLTRIPECDFSGVSGVFDRVFASTSGSPLVTIDKVILPPEGNITSFNGAFDSCSKLKNIVLEGVLDKSISFSACPLSVESMKSIISCLKDYTGTTSEHTYTLTFKTSVFNALEAEGATAEYNGAECTWAELIDNKKWNLTLA